MRRLGALHRRGEGHVEYIIITGMIMICALVALFAMVNSVREIAGDLRLCIGCDEENELTDDEKKTAEERKTGDEGKSGEEKKSEDGKTEGEKKDDASEEESWLAWLGYLGSWFSGNRPFWEFIGTYA